MNTSADVVVEIIKVIGALVTTCVVPYMAFRMKQLEKNTNSIVTRLVASTEKVSEQLGKDKEVAAQKSRDDGRAEGKAEGIAEAEAKESMELPK